MFKAVLSLIFAAAIAIAPAKSQAANPGENSNCPATGCTGPSKPAPPVVKPPSGGCNVTVNGKQVWYKVCPTK